METGVTVISPVFWSTSTSIAPAGSALPSNSK
jgi:hypothetical protein